MQLCLQVDGLNNPEILCEDGCLKMQLKPGQWILSESTVQVFQKLISWLG